MARMILENGWYEVETSQDNGIFKNLPSNEKKERITYFPKMYYRMEYVLLYDTIANRITINEVRAENGKLRLMKNVWWEYDNSPTCWLLAVQVEEGLILSLPLLKLCYAVIRWCMC